MRSSRLSAWLAPLVLFGAVAVEPGSARAEVRSYTLAVAGLGCAFRAFGLERELYALDGVRRVTLQLAEGRVAVELTPEATVMPAAIEERVRAAGLVLEDMEATALGTVRGAGREARLLLGGNRVFRLLPGDASEALGALVTAGKRSVEVSGAVRRHGDGWGLDVVTVREPDEGGGCSGRAGGGC